MTTGKDHDASSAGLRASFKSPKCPVSAQRQVVHVLAKVRGNANGGVAFSLVVRFMGTEYM